MLMCKNNITKMAVVIFMVALTIVPMNVFAESQIKRPTYQNQTVYCSLDCDFNLTTDDEAIATTEWSGNTGYTLKTVLWQCQDSKEDYKKLGVSTGAKIAKVSRSKSGVWRFLSKHYGRKGNNDNQNTKLVAISDW